MARPLRIEFPGAIYHVSSRMLGPWRQNRDRLFGNGRDRERFLHRLSEGVRDFSIRGRWRVVISSDMRAERSGKSLSGWAWERGEQSVPKWPACLD